MIFSEGREVEVTPDEEWFKEAWYTATILKLPNNNNTKGKALVQYKNIFIDDNGTPFTENVPLSNIRPLPPQPKVPDDQSFQVKDVVDAFYLDGWWTGSVSKAFDNPKRYTVTFSDPTEDVEFSSSELRPHWKWVDGKWVQSSKLQEVMVSSDCEKPMELSNVGTSGQLERSDAVKCISQKLEPCCISSRKSEMGLSNASKEPAKNKHVKRATIEADATPLALRPCKKPRDGSMDTGPPKVEGVSAENVDLLKKNGRLQKFDVEGQQHPAADEKMKAAIGVSEVQIMTKEAESSVSGESPTECRSRTVTEESCHFLKEETNQQKEHDVSRCKKDVAKTGINRIEQPNVVLEIKQPKLVPRNSQSLSAGKDNAAGFLEETFSEEQTAMEVESAAISGLEQAGHIPHGFANQQNDPNEKSLELTLQSPLVGMTGDNEPQECHDLPFVKSLPMWKEVESMEIFQVMPQNPHFRPLVKLKEILREGSAVGHMLSFASMVQRISKLTVANPRKHFTSISDVLPDFEILGFDVKAINDRTSDLLLMKDRHENLQDHSKEVKLQVKRYSDELTKLNEEIDANYKKMRELEEKQALLFSTKESKTSQLTTLQVSSDVTAQDIQSVKYDFKSLAGSPW